MRYAGFWIRLWALVLDTLLFAVPAAVLTFVVFPSSATAHAWIIGIENVLFLIYWVCFQAVSGQTLGKRAAGIRVVAIDGGMASMRAVLLRNLWFAYGLVKPVADVYALLAVSPAAFALATEHERGAMLLSNRPHWYGFALLALSLWWLAEVIALVRSTEKRSLHDRLAGTSVIFTRQGVQSDA